MNHRNNILIVPLAGEGSRFKDVYSEPKPMIQIDEKSIIEHSMDSFDWTWDKIIFIVRSEHVQNWHIDSFLKQKIGTDVVIVECDGLTKGAVETVLLAKPHVNKNDSIFIWGSDVKIEPSFDINSVDWNNQDGFLLTFKSNSPNYSYCKLDEKNNVVEVKEKKVISDYANVGLYGFSKWSIFEKYANKMMKSHNGELHIAPLYQYMIDDGMKVKTKNIDVVHIFGTPNELTFYKKVVLGGYESGKTVGIVSDHSGYDFKETIKHILNRQSIKYIDFGCYSPKNSDYGDWSKRAIEAYNDGIVDFIFSCCATGQGQNQFINKNSELRNAEVWNEYTMRMAIEHNGSNSFSFPSKLITIEEFEQMMKTFTTTKFQAGRHQNRVMKTMGLA